MSRTGLSALALPATAVVALLWLIVACASNGVGVPTQPPPSSSQRTTATAPSVAPSPTPTATASASASASASAAASASSSPTSTASADPNAPPAGWLSAGGEPVQGLGGTYCWHAGGTTCADFPAFTDRQPDLPPVTAGPSGSQLSFSLAGNYPFGSWAASYVDDNGDVVPLGGEQSSFDPDANHASTSPQTMVELPNPPAGGNWIVQVFVRFTNGGDASYGWNVTVP